MQAPIYITPKEVATMLRICERTLYTYVEEKRLPSPIWLGGKRLWPAQTIHDYIASRNRKRG